LGQVKSRTKTAMANQQLTEYTVEQDKQNFQQQIVTQVSLFNVMKEQLVYTAEADSIASEKYQIARERYVLGDLSITDLGIAFREMTGQARLHNFAPRFLGGILPVALPVVI